MFLPPTIVLAPQTQAPPLIPVKELYTKTEYRIPMRDGVKLYVQVYRPKAGGAHPILMERTPYGAGPKGDAFTRFRGSRKLVDAGYIFAYGDVRGKGESEGEYENVRPLLVNPAGKQTDEATDAYDTVDFLVRNVPDNNGRVGFWGISYPGFYAATSGVRTHPAVRAVSPQAPVSDWFLGDDVHHNGAFFMQESFDFSGFFDIPRGAESPKIDRGGKTAYDFYLGTGALANLDRNYYKGAVPYWNEFLAHDTYDAYWKARSLPRHFQNVRCAVMTVGGFFDKEDMWGALNVYKASERRNPGIPNTLVMGPWTHGQWAGRAATLGDQSFGADTAKFYQDEVEFPFFQKYLNGANVPAPPEALCFETGANAWRSYAKWPPASKPLSAYLYRSGALSPVPSQWPEAGKIEADPSNPTPYLPDWKTSKRAPSDWLIQDQRFVKGRPDVATFRSEPLPRDLRIGGAITADMWVKSTGTDGDLVVKVIDEYPADDPTVSAKGTKMAGYEMMLRSDIFRMKFRDSFEDPKPLAPGKPEHVRFTMNDTLHTFKAGHRMVVQVQPYWFPIADRNPNVFMPVLRATDADYRKATVTLLSGPKTSSRIILPVLP